MLLDITSFMKLAFKSLWTRISALLFREGKKDFPGFWQSFFLTKSFHAQLLQTRLLLVIIMRLPPPTVLNYFVLTPKLFHREPDLFAEM